MSTFRHLLHPVVQINCLSPLCVSHIPYWIQFWVLGSSPEENPFLEPEYSNQPLQSHRQYQRTSSKSDVSLKVRKCPLLASGASTNPVNIPTVGENTKRIVFDKLKPN